MTDSTETEPAGGPTAAAGAATHFDAEKRAMELAVLDALRAVVDPEMARRLAPGDTQRVVRAYEVVKATGRSLAEYHRSQPTNAGPSLATIVIAPEWSDLDPAIAVRCRRMLDTGALDEVRALLSLGLDPALPVMKAVGVRELARYLSGEIGLEGAMELFRVDATVRQAAAHLVSSPARSRK